MSNASSPRYPAPEGDAPPVADELGLQSAKKRVAPNIVSNLVVVAMNAGVSILLTSFIVRRLGTEAFGMVSLANSFSAFMHLAMLSISGSLLRFMSLNVGEGERANEFFNTAFFAVLFLTMILFVPIVVFSWQVPNLFVCAPGLEFDTSVLVFLILVTCLVSGIVSCIQAVFFLYHRFVYLNVLTILTQIVALGLLVGMLWYSVNIVAIGVYRLVFVAGCAGVLFISAMRFQRAFRVRWGLGSWGHLRQLLRVGGIVLVYDTAGVLLLSGTVLVLNRTLGAEATGRFGPVLQVVTFQMLLAFTIARVLRPILFEYIRLGDADRLRGALFKATRILGYLAGFTMAMLCGLARPILTWWVGAEFAPLAYLLALCVYAGYIGGVLWVPYRQVFRGRDSLVAPTVILLGISAVHVVVLYLALSYTDWGFSALGIIFLVTVGVGQLVLNALHCDYIVTDPFGKSLGRVHASLWFPLVIAVALAWVLGESLDWRWVLLCGGVAAVFYATAGYLMMLKPEDRKTLWSLMRRRSRES